MRLRPDADVWNWTCHRCGYAVESVLPDDVASLRLRHLGDHAAARPAAPLVRLLREAAFWVGRKAADAEQHAQVSKLSIALDAAADGAPDAVEALQAIDCPVHKGSVGLYCYAPGNERVLYFCHVRICALAPPPGQTKP